MGKKTLPRNKLAKTKTCILSRFRQSSQGLETRSTLMMPISILAQLSRPLMRVMSSINKTSATKWEVPKILISNSSTLGRRVPSRSLQTVGLRQVWRSKVQPCLSQTLSIRPKPRLTAFKKTSIIPRSTGPSFCNKKISNNTMRVIRWLLILEMTSRSSRDRKKPKRGKPAGIRRIES